MVRWEDHLPTIAMVALQGVYAGNALLTRAALVKGMSPRIFIFYRQAIAHFGHFSFCLYYKDLFLKTRMGEVQLFMDKSSRCCMTIRSFLLIFVTAFIGVVLNQTVYFEGLYLASSSIGTAMSNLVPAVTFLIAAIMGLEQVNLKRMSSIAKILGTCFCVGGAILMAFLKGPKLLNVQLPSASSLVLHSVGSNDDQTWLLGCLFLFASSWCWSLWLILQVPITACYPNHISLSAWMCFLATLQAGTIALVLEKEPQDWIFSSPLELTCCFFSGIFGSGIQFFVQSWCIQRRGPLFSALFNPLCTVITTIIASIFLHEEIYVGNLIGSITVIGGLYVVLWGKAQELKGKMEVEPKLENNEGLEKTNSKVDLEQPLLKDISNDQD